MLRDTFLELLDCAEWHVRERVAAAEAGQLLRDVAVFRRAADFPSERDVLHACEKFLHWCCWYARGDEGLRAELAPFVGMALAARERLGGPSLLPAAI